MSFPDEAARRVADVIEYRGVLWGFVNNHFEGFSPETCQRLANRLGFELPLPSAEETASADPGQLDLFARKEPS